MLAREYRRSSPRSLVATILLTTAAASPCAAQTVNLDQLRRVLAGETIPEAPADDGGGPAFTEEFFLEHCRFAADGRNLFFSLEPCYQLVLAGDDEGEFVELFITVLDETRDVVVEVDDRRREIRTRVVEEREFKDGELFEISRNYYARCVETGDVFYFGEDVCFYAGGQCVSTDGSWLAGVDGATPGIIMPGSFLLGSRYFQEQAPGVALDRARHVRMDLEVGTPAGAFDDCVEVFEDSALDPTAETTKLYAPGIGLIGDDVLELVSYGFIPGCGGK